MNMTSDDVLAELDEMKEVTCDRMPAAGISGRQVARARAVLGEVSAKDLAEHAALARISPSDLTPDAKGAR